MISVEMTEELHTNTSSSSYESFHSNQTEATPDSSFLISCSWVSKDYQV